MQSYALYIEDDRYSVPTLVFISADDELDARRLAREKLAEPHHRSVEVHDGEAFLFRLVASDADRHGAASEPQAGAAAG